MRDQCRLFAEAGHELAVYTWRPGKPLRDESWNVVPVAPLGSASVFAGDGAPDALEKAPWRLAEAPLAMSSMLARLMREPRPDLYLGHWFVPGGLAARLAGWLRGVPSGVVGHSAGIHLLRRLRGSRRWLDVVATGPTTVPTSALALLVDRAGVRKLPMGFHPADVARPVDARAVLCFGRMVPIKGFGDVMAALSGLDLPVHVAGDGPALSAVRRRAVTAEVDATFHGFVDRRAQRELFRECSIALFPSRQRRDGRHEGWPVSIMEVSSAGVIPLVSDWPGASEMVVRPELQVVPARPRTEGERVGEWHRAIRRLLALDATRLQALRQETRRLARRFTWSALGADWIEWLEAAGRSSRGSTS